MVSRSGVLTFIEGVVSIVCGIFYVLLDGEQNHVLKTVAELVLDFRELIENLTALLDANSTPREVQVRTVKPHLLLAKGRPQFFYRLLNNIGQGCVKVTRISYIID